MMTNICITCGVPISYEDRQICKACENHGKEQDADLVKVVRCKDCENYKCEQYNCWKMRIKMKPTDFCSYGVRKEVKRGE